MSHPLSADPSYLSRVQQRSRLTRAGRLAVLEERTRLINRIQLLEEKKNLQVSKGSEISARPTRL